MKIMSTNIRFFFCCLTVLIFLSSCGYRQEYLVSEPRRASGKNINYSIIDNEDFSIHVRLYNDVRKLDMSYFVVIPTKIDRSNTPLFDSEFRVLVAIFPKKNTMSLDINDVYLKIDGQKHKVKYVKGPVSYFPYKNFALPKNMNIETEKKFVDQGIIFSVVNRKTDTVKLGNDDVTIYFTQVGLWNIYELFFDTPTVSPKNDITLILNKIRTENEVISIEPISFRTATYVDIGSVP